MGIIFSKSGKKIDPDRVSAISAFPPITTLKECQKFLGTVNYVSSFIPHYATCMYPVYNLLKKSNSQTFKMTEEAQLAIDKIKEFLKQKTMVYNANLSEPLYLSVDASQVGVGALLYQITLYPKTAEGEKTMLKDLGYLPSQNKEDHMILGISPGRNTPIITAFLQDKSQLSKYDIENSLL